MSEKAQKDAGGSSAVRRRRLTKALQSIAKAQQDAIDQYTRQIPFEDLFSQKEIVGNAPTVLQPPYAPGRMYKLYEENGTLSACIEACVDNVNGFGHDVVPIEGVDGEEQKDTPEKTMLEQFFATPNDRESMITLRKQLYRDKYVTGNAYMEVVRDRKSRPFALFWADAKRTRMCAVSEPCQVMVTLMRQGLEVQIPVQRYFRKFVMIHGSAKAGEVSTYKIRYFKEYGDPRHMNALTGDYFLTPPPSAKGEPYEEATEMVHFKHGNDSYGVPQWIGTVLPAMGMSKADFVNYDLFDSQGIPPLLILLSGGQLTDDSFNDMLALFRKAKGAQSFNKLLLLEAESPSGTIDGKEGAVKLDVKPLSEARKEDAMFLSYLADSREAIRMFGFRLPGLFLGATKDEKHETAFVARMLAEEQIFAPERQAFDEIINAMIVKDLGAKQFKFQSLGPVLQSNPEILALLPVLIESGVFTVNELIAFVNNQFNLSLEPYNEAWANEPIKPMEPQPPQGQDGNKPKDNKDMKKKNDRVYAALQELEEVATRYVLRGCSDDGCKHTH